MFTKYHKFWLSIFIICILIGFVIVSQYNTIKRTNNRHLLDVNPNKIILNLIQQNSNLKSKISNLNSSFENKQKSVSSNEYTNNKYNDLMNDLSLTYSEGEYFSVNLKGKIDINDFIDLIHFFWFINSKAISINNNRIAYNSFFSKMNDEILLNGKVLGKDINLEIIGDNSEIEKYINQPDGIFSRLNNKGIIAEFKFKPFFRID